MARLGSKLRTMDGGLIGFWCPACEESHVVNGGWYFNGDGDRPTLTPSVKVSYNGRDAGQVSEDGDRAPYAVCHFFVTSGKIQYCADSTHPLAGRTVDLPDFPGDREI